MWNLVEIGLRRFLPYSPLTSNLTPLNPFDLHVLGAASVRPEPGSNSPWKFIYKVHRSGFAWCQNSVNPSQIVSGLFSLFYRAWLAYIKSPWYSSNLFALIFLLFSFIRTFPLLGILQSAFLLIISGFPAPRPPLSCYGATHILSLSLIDVKNLNKLPIR